MKTILAAAFAVIALVAALGSGYAQAGNCQMDCRSTGQGGQSCVVRC
jgi:hypothetical protein